MYKQDTHTSCMGEKDRAHIPIHTHIHTQSIKWQPEMQGRSQWAAFGGSI